METDDPVLKLFPAKCRAVLVISAGIVLQFTYGLVYTFGNLLPYLASYLRWKVDPNQTQGSLIWLQTGFPFAMLTGGYMEQLYGARWGAAFGSALYTVSLALTYWAINQSYLWVILTLGLVGSFGTGVAYNCVLIQSQKWLPHRIGLVSGLITAGFGSGAFLIAPIQTKFINPDNLNVNEQGYFTQEELLERVPKMFTLLALIFGILQIIALFFIADPKTSTTANVNDDDDEEVGNEGANAFHSSAVRRPLLSRHSIASSTFSSYSACHYYRAPTLLTARILRSATFFCLFFTLLLNGIWCQVTSGLFKAYGQTFIHDDFFLATVNSFAAAANCLSRIFWGAFADRSSYQITMNIACALGALLMWTLGVVELLNSPVIFFVWICAMFCCIGATYSLIPYAAHKCFGSEKFGVSYGSIQLALFISGIITALASQFLLDLVGFHVMFTAVAGTMFISMMLTIYLPKTKYGLPVD